MALRARRIAAVLLLAAALAPGTWLREKPPVRHLQLDLRFAAQKLPPPAELAKHLGPFELEGAWVMESRRWRFGGYSALLPIGDGQLLAFSDRGYRLYFSPPGNAQHPPRVGMIAYPEYNPDDLFDAESATIDPATGRVWVGWENGNAITRHTLKFRGFAKVNPPAMRGWGINSGPESMVRLADGRFLVLREGSDGWLDSHRHRALLFAGDPLVKTKPLEFTFVGIPGFRPVDIAQLPDGRVLILMRKLVWPMPPRFVGRIMIADPRTIARGREWHGHEVAKLSTSLRVDNFEGLAIEPREDGRLTVWLISDDNNAVAQETLLWKLAVDPAKLP